MAPTPTACIREHLLTSCIYEGNMLKSYLYEGVNEEADPEQDLPHRAQPPRPARGGSVLESYIQDASIAYVQCKVGIIVYVYTRL